MPVTFDTVIRVTPVHRRDPSPEDKISPPLAIEPFAQSHTQSEIPFVVLSLDSYEAIPHLEQVAMKFI